MLNFAVRMTYVNFWYTVLSVSWHLLHRKLPQCHSCLCSQENSFQWWSIQHENQHCYTRLGMYICMYHLWPSRLFLEPSTLMPNFLFVSNVLFKLTYIKKLLFVEWKCGSWNIFWNVLPEYKEAWQGGTLQNLEAKNLSF